MTTQPQFFQAPNPAPAAPSYETILHLAINGPMSSAIHYFNTYFATQPQNPEAHPTLGNLLALADVIDTLWAEAFQGASGVNLVSCFLRFKLEPQPADLLPGLPASALM